MKKVFVIILTNLMIGNVISWLMGSWPIDMPKIPYTQFEQMTLDSLNEELTEFGDESDLLTELGTLYSLHNELDKAETYLSKAIELDQNNATAIAMNGANSAKQAGAMLDFSMGIYKVWSLWEGCDAVNLALEMEPDNTVVRLTRVAAFAAIGGINRYFDKVFEDEKWFLELIEREGEQLPLEIKQQFYLSMAQAYLAEADSPDSVEGKKAQQYFADWQRQPVTTTTDVKAIELQLAMLTEE